MPHCVCSAAREVEHGREGRHSALQKRPHNLAYIATSQKGMACTPRDPKCGRFFFIFLDFGHAPSQPFLASRGQPRGGGGGAARGGGGVGQPTQLWLAAASNTPIGNGLLPASLSTQVVGRREPWCSRHRGGGVGICACRAVLCRAVRCRPWGGWGQRGLVPSRAKCSYPTRSFVEAHMYQWFRFGRHVALFGDCCICKFLCVASWCCTMCFPTH